MDFLRGMIIGCNSELATELEGIVSGLAPTLSLRKVCDLPGEAELESMIRVFKPSIVFLDISDFELGEFICALIRKQVRGPQIVGFAGSTTHEILLMAVRNGLRDVLESPISPATVQQCLSRAFSVLEEDSEHTRFNNQIFSFLPSKIGSGASTVALHTAYTMARSSDSPVALLDLDFDSGLVDFMLKLPANQGLSHISELGDRMDASIWSRVATKVGRNLDVLRAGSHNKPRRILTSDIEHLIAYARHSYEITCVDLPGSLNDHSLAVLDKSDGIFMVLTPDLPSVHLARRRLDQFHEMRLANRVRVVYNRAHSRSPLSKAEIEEILERDIFHVIDNDYTSLQKALLNGRPIEADTQLGRQFADMTNRILGVDPKKKKAGSLVGAGFLSALRNLLSGSAPLPEARNARIAASAATAATPRLLEAAPGACEDSAMARMAVGQPVVEKPSRPDLNPPKWMSTELVRR